MTLPVLHIWPGDWGLLSVHPPSLTAVLHLQLTVPGKFNVSYCTNPDLSPSGTLPFLTHGDQLPLSSLSSIIKYISSLEGDTNLDAGLNSFEVSQKTAWCSHVEANIGNLVSYMLYSLPANWAKLTHPTLAYSLPVPQRYYVPQRIRNMHRARLEAAGLWNQQPVELKKTETATDHKEQIAQTFQRDKIVQTARDCLDIYARFLGTNQFFYHGRLTTLDITVAAHVLLLIKPPFPDTLLSDLLIDSYPTLVGHAERVLEQSFKVSAPLESRSNSHSIWSLIPSLPARPAKSEEDVHYERMTWGWVALAVGSVGLYLLAMGSPIELNTGDAE
ncbi:hypothetical protein B0H16DRAFT_1509435 [Mycena metata]|uniref:Mitochondrial outer membrane transport complex Sam37/metaxin N-terminal domain-containing protein n=1 Tax=Mycena metata TaxID=1033252 RepID=A0AAD7JZK6_9AGAR|nr:hypothetical protein B0H16DRAFT_1509435 [Mycena metata]